MPRKISVSSDDQTKDPSKTSAKQKSTTGKLRVSGLKAQAPSKNAGPGKIQFRLEEPILDSPDLQARIAIRAHELYVHRGGHHGQDLADWFEAERQVLAAGT